MSRFPLFKFMAKTIALTHSNSSDQNNVAKINNYPLTIRVPNKIFVEGYWRPNDCNDNNQNNEHKYPTPLPTNIPVNRIFLARYKNYMTLIDKSERDSCAYDLDDQPCSSVILYRGLSMCRLCDNYNGASEYTLVKGKIQFVTPSGLIHYYETHGVQPSKEFTNFIMSDEELVLKKPCSDDDDIFSFQH